MKKLAPYVPLALPLLLFVMLSACQSPSPRFLDSPKLEVSAAGFTYAVYVDADEVEVHRTSRALHPELSKVVSGAVIAVEQVTRCKVVPGSVKGDQAIIKAKIDCS